jgi:membrane dipeptidase
MKKNGRVVPVVACLALLGLASKPLAAQRCDPKPPIDYAAAPGDDAITLRAKEIHARVLTLDTHVDIEPRNFLPDSINYCHRLPGTQVDLTKMEAGGLDAIFFSIYVGQGALDSAGFARAYAVDTAKFNSVHRLAEVLAPDRIAIARTAADARRIFASGKKIAFMGVENGYGIANDLTRVKEFYDRGARYMSLAHNGHNQLSDSNTGEADGQWMWNGLSPLGKKVIAEMNRVGIMIDISHPSKASMMQTLEITKAPIIASHSGVRAICDNSRNLDDEQLKALAKNGGVVQIVAYYGFISCNPKADTARQQALADLMREYSITPPATGRGGRGAGGGRGGRPAALAAGDPASAPVCRAVQADAASRVLTAAVDSQLALLPKGRRDEYGAKQSDIARRFPPTPTGTVQDFVDHIDYAVKLIGLEHVGISSDFDGGGGLVGYNCALDAINVTRELVRRGYTEEQIGKIWSGNLLRVLEQVEQVAKRLQAQQKRSGE